MKERIKKGMVGVLGNWTGVAFKLLWQDSYDPKESERTLQAWVYESRKGFQRILRGSIAEAKKRKNESWVDEKLVNISSILMVFSALMSSS